MTKNKKIIIVVGSIIIIGSAIVLLQKRYYPVWFMTTSNKGIEFIKSVESFSPTAYIDDYAPTKDRVEYSIGYGHQILPNEQYLYTAKIDTAKATELLKKDIRVAELQVQKSIHVELTQNQFDSLVSFCYNVGIGNFAKSTLVKRINECSNKNDIAEAFLMWTNKDRRSKELNNYFA